MATESKQDTGKQSGNDILLTLNTINRGRLVNEANSKLDELIAAVKRYEQSGTITITLKVENGAAPDTVNVTGTATVKAPQPKHPAVFFVDDTDRLTRDDPSMDPMFGRDEIGGTR